MTRLVADASAIVDVLAGAPGAPAIRAQLSAVAEIDVPEHFHVEAISALRGLLRRRDLSPASGAGARALKRQWLSLSSSVRFGLWQRASARTSSS